MSSAMAFGSRLGPEFSTSIIELGQHAEQHNMNWRYARYRGDVSYGVRTLAQLQELRAFHRARHGQERGFRVKHHLDYQAAGQFLLVQNPAAALYQLIKDYQSGSTFYRRRITKPVGVNYPVGNPYDSIALVRAGGPLTPGTHYTLDYTTGLVTLNAPLAPGETLYWSGEFDVPMRFASDHFPTSLLAVRSRTIPGHDLSGTPGYFPLLDAASATRYVWVDAFQQITTALAPPGPPFVPLFPGSPPAWIQVTDNDAQNWWIVFDELAQLSATRPQPPGTGLIFGPGVLQGVPIMDEAELHHYVLTVDTLGQITLRVTDTATAGQSIFDALGETASIPILEDRR